MFVGPKHFFAEIRQFCHRQRDPLDKTGHHFLLGSKKQQQQQQRQQRGNKHKQGKCSIRSKGKKLTGLSHKCKMFS